MSSANQSSLPKATINTDVNFLSQTYKERQRKRETNKQKKKHMAEEYT